MSIRVIEEEEIRYTNEQLRNIQLRKSTSEFHLYR